MARAAAFKLALTSVLLAATLAGPAPAAAKGPMDSPTAGAAASIQWAELPRQGRET